jgi:hypothetical protein
MVESPYSGDIELNVYYALARREDNVISSHFQTLHL